MKTLLICHAGAELDHPGLSGWLASFSDLTGVIILRERGGRLRQRVRREVQRVGLLRFLDVLAFRLYYKLALAGQDRKWEQYRLAELRERYPLSPDAVPVLQTHSPNSDEAKAFIQAHRPDIMLARCKSLLKSSVFSIPTHGAFVMHPGLCPEYRNAHGCFWALANNEPDKVAMTLLKIDAGVDTGPVYGYYGCAFDERQATHVQIQHQTVLDNLDELQLKLQDIAAGVAQPLDTTGRPSAAWGQPWLTRWLAWKSQARRGPNARSLSPVS